MENLYVAGEVSGDAHGRNRLYVFRRRAGENTALKAKQVKPGKLTLDHVKSYHQELKKAGLEHQRVLPMLLPDYRREDVKARRVEIF